MQAVDSILGIKAPQTDAQRRTYAARVAKARKFLLRSAPTARSHKPRRKRGASGTSPVWIGQTTTPTAEIKALGKVTAVLLPLPLEARARVLTLARTFVLGEPGAPAA